MKFKLLFPFGVACLASLLIGFSDWFPHAKLVQSLGKIVVNVCVLLWVVYDAKERNIRIGDWTALFILITQPIGLIIWLIYLWKWRAYGPLIVFAFIWFTIGTLLYSGLILGGLFFGYSFSSLLELFL